MDMVHYNILVKGKVQGVWFRKYTKDQAESIGIYGYVQNDNDGNVFIEAEGTPKDLNSLIKALGIGPPLSQVSEVLFHIDNSKGFTEFKIRR